MDKMLETLADFSSSLTYEKLGKETIYQAKRRILDTLGCVMGAFHMEPPRIFRHYAMQVTANPGATILGTKIRTSLEMAALANGVMGRYLDFNDTSHTKNSGHPSDMIPAMLSTAEYAGANGKKFITGVVVAYEIMDRMGETWGITGDGFDYTTYVAIGSAAGAGNILGLDREQMANAISLATSSYIGLLQIRVGNLSMWKGSSPGNASRNGVFAALIAKAGLTGPPDVFFGPSGFLHQLTKGDVTALKPFGGPDNPYMVETSKFKFYPTDYECQSAANPAVELHQLLKGRLDEIEKVVIYGYKFAIGVGVDSRDKWNPKTRETADHSLPYVIATALTRGEVWMDDFEEKNFRDPARLALMQKIEAYEDPEYTKDYPESYRFRIEVTLRSGEKLVREVRYAKGHPKNTLTDQEVETKFRKLTKPVMLPKMIDLALEKLWHFEEVNHLSEIITLFEL